MTRPTMGTAPGRSGGRGLRSCELCGASYRSEFTCCPRDGGALASSGADPLLGAALGEHYVIDALIGEGAMARVYRAHHSLLAHKHYAVKVLFGDLAASAEMRMRFAHEADAASRLDHPHVVRVVDVGRTPAGLMYLVMELVEGTTLGRLLRSGPMSSSRVIRISRQLCEGLAHAHERGVVHRDFKPENILVVGSPGEEVARIADFGLAISMSGDDARLTATGIVCTPAYAAPEQLAGGEVDHRADLYALGTTMFEMLSGGEMPFEGEPQRLMSAKLSAEAPSIATLVPEVPAALAGVIALLLRRDVDDRPGSAREVCERLDAVAFAPTIAVSLPPVPVAPRSRVLRGGLAGVAIGGLIAVVAAFASTGEVAPPVDHTAPAAPDRIPPLLAPPPIDELPVRPTSHIARETAPRPGRVATAQIAIVAPVVEVVASAPEPAVPVPIVPPQPSSVPAPPSAPAAAAPPRIAALDVQGALSPAVVRRAIDRVVPELRACAAEVGAQTLAVRFSIQDSRRATDLRAAGAGASCVTAVLAQVRTEVAPDVGDAQVTVSLAFGGGT